MRVRQKAQSFLYIINKEPAERLVWTSIVDEATLGGLPGDLQGIHEEELKALDILAKGPCDVVILCENTSTFYIGPDVYRQYSHRHVKNFVDIIHAAGKTAIIHMCEYVKNLLDQFKGIGDELRKRRLRRLIEMGLLNEKTVHSPRNPHIQSWAQAGHKDWQAERMAVYAAQIDCVGQSVGRILNTLKEASVEETTLIMFLSDNGPAKAEVGPDWFIKLRKNGSFRRDGVPMRWGNSPSIMPGPADTFCSYGLPWANVSSTPFKGFKSDNYEGGISTPFIVHWPGLIKKGGAITHQPGHIIDIMATCLDIAGN